MVTESYISKTTLNGNGLNAPTKRYTLAEQIKKKKKQYPSISCLQQTYLRPRDMYRLKVRGWEKIFYMNVNQKKTVVAILISDKTDFKTKDIITDKK